MIKRMLGAAALLALWGAPAAAARAEDQALNAVYETVARAKAGSLTEDFIGAFGEQAMVVDARPGPALVGEDFRSRLRQMAGRIRADGVRVEAQYRIERRVVDGDLALDTGFMKQVMKLPGGEDQVHYARFMTTLRRTAAGWKIVGDASMPATAQAWEAAPRSEGLKYDG